MKKTINKKFLFLLFKIIIIIRYKENFSKKLYNRSQDNNYFFN